MRVVVTGNLGYIGPVVVHHLAGLSAVSEVHGLDTAFFAARLTDQHALAERELRSQWFGDVRDIGIDRLRGMDAIVHLAAISNDPMSRRYEALTEEINWRASIRLARLARAAGVKRFVFASSCSVYGAAEQEWVNEASPTGPLTPYALSKLRTEADLAQLASETFQVTCFRFGTAYGWSPRLRLDLVLNDFVASALASGEIVLSSTGDAWRPLIHVRDMARAIEWGLIRSETDGSFLVVNAGSTSSNWRIRDLAGAVAGAFPGVPIRMPASAPADRRSYRVDFSRLAALAPRHTPRENLNAAVEEMKAGLQRLGYQADRRSHFVRLNTLEELQEDSLLTDTLRWRDARNDGHTCRLCGDALRVRFADLGETPLANDYPRPDDAGLEARFPLDAWVCTSCWLVQLGHKVPPESIFSEYAYLSSYSPSWVEHARRFSVAATARLALGPQSRVIEVASNDGYLLQHFVQAGIPSLGVEPADNVACLARERGVDTVNRFFNAATAQELAATGWQADLIVANNVLAHVPDLHDFIAGFRLLLRPDGAAAFEFPHLLELIQGSQFDTIYHEHYSYFSLLAAERLMSMHDLRIFDVERLPTHGGSLRLWVCRKESSRFAESETVSVVRELEEAAKLNSVAGYATFASEAERCRRSLVALLDRLHAEGKSVAAYGAAAKGNTLLNYCGVGSDRIDFVADRNPLKQGRVLPGSRIPIVPPEEIERRKPDYLLILPWNLTDEIRSQMASIRNWGGRFIRPIPEVVELP